MKTVEDVRAACTKMIDVVNAIRQDMIRTELWFCNMPSDKIVKIKIIRAATQFGLKEAKDASDMLDPLHEGGTLGPLVFKGTLANARLNLKKYTKQYGSFPLYKDNWIKTGVFNVAADWSIQCGC